MINAHNKVAIVTGAGSGIENGHGGSAGERHYCGRAADGLEPRRQRRALHGQPAARHQCPVLDDYGNEDAVSRPRLIARSKTEPPPLHLSVSGGSSAPHSPRRARPGLTRSSVMRIDTQGRNSLYFTPQKTSSCDHPIKGNR